MEFFSNFKLTCGDTMQYLQQMQEQVDMIFADPPYFISGGGKTIRGKRVVVANFGDWDKNFYGLEEVFKEGYRILKDGGTMICFYDLWKIETIKRYYDDNKFKQIRFIEWLKTNPVPINSKINYLTNSREVAVLGVKKSKPTFHSSYDNGLYQYPICQDTGRFHPTQKPLAFMKELIEKHSNEGDIVLDCFSGSGTIGVAALTTNRKFLGCEINPEYYEKSLERIKSLEGSH